MSSQTGRSVEAIYTEFHDRLRRFVLKRVSDPLAADDIVQDVYFKIHHHIDTLREVDRLESWLFQITRNTITDYYRRARPQDELSEAVASADEDEEKDAAAQLAESINGMMACLPEQYREALELTEFKGMSQVELAAHLNISVSGAKSRVQRAREKLKEAFLDCCHIEFDRLGKIIDYHPNCEACARGANC